MFLLCAQLTFNKNVMVLVVVSKLGCSGLVFVESEAEIKWCIRYCRDTVLSLLSSLPSARQYLSYGDCLEVKREYYQNCHLLDCVTVTQCSQSTAHLCEQFLQVKQIGLVTLGPLRCA